MTRVSTLLRPACRADSAAISNMLAEMSVARTRPLEPTRWAATKVESPPPPPPPTALGHLDEVEHHLRGRSERLDPCSRPTAPLGRRFAGSPRAASLSLTSLFCHRLHPHRELFKSLRSARLSHGSVTAQPCNNY